MKIKCFKVEVINYNDKRSGEPRTLYKVWFIVPSGVGWLLTSKKTNQGDEVELGIIPLNTQDVKTNMQLGLQIV